MPDRREQSDVLSSASSSEKPILFVDVDGVISLFGFPPSAQELPGRFYWVDGVAHCIPSAAGPRLVRLAEAFQLVWATGWEQRANEHLPFILKLPFGDLPCLDFAGRAVWGSSHWKLEALSEYASEHPVAWIDDNLGPECQLWAVRREAPTLLVPTHPAVGMTEEHVDELLSWAGAVASKQGTEAA
jgi:hypothetical protein